MKTQRSPSPRSPAARVGGEARWEFTIPGWHPVKLNELLGCHWATAQRKKNSVTRAVRTFSHLVPTASTKRRVTLKITLGPRQMAGDPDAYWKALLDSMVLCGLLVDDNRKWVELMPVAFERGPAKATTITLEDIES